MMSTKRDYFALDREMGRIWDRFAECTDSNERYRLLLDAYETERAMAEMHREVFGSAPIEWEGDRDLAESMRSSALVLLLLADVEHVASIQARRFTTDTWLEPYAGRVLDEMAAESDAAKRAKLLKDLYDAVVDVVGGQAAETLACIPYANGRRGWTDELSLPNSFPKLVRAVWREWRESRAS